MDNKQLAILNSLVTFAAENVPGGLGPEEMDVARLVGEQVRGYSPPEENQIFEYKVVNAGSHRRSWEDSANRWSKHGWRIVAALPETSMDYTSYVLERPKDDIRTEVIKLEVDLERIFHEAAGALPQDAGELLNLIREIEKEHDNPN